MIVNKVDKVNVKNRRNNLIGTGTGTGTLILHNNNNQYLLELRTTPDIRTKYTHMAKEAAYIVHDDPEPFLEVVGGAVLKGITGALTHTDTSHVRTGTGRAFGRQMEDLKKHDYNLQEITSAIWKKELKNATRLKLETNGTLELHMRNKDVFFIIFPNHSKASKWFDLLADLLCFDRS